MPKHPRFHTLLALTVMGASALPYSVHAQSLTVEQARIAVTPFYDALNAVPGKDASALVMQATTPDWVSCSGQHDCKPRDKVAPSIAGFGKVIPDLKWEIKELLVNGNRVVVRGEASGTPVSTFMGVPNTGKSFRIMSIDIHTVENGKLIRSYHVEDWMSAVRQLSSK
ncbi:ester cyclase [Serratia microhaemolytica]|uniref:ester cyclase n=1 Tax=Serratia microhaemolytica TaxID=2675110 RepID=UPI00197D883A|nr:ester cyclase [Serratia microhaemolytica]